MWFFWTLPVLLQRLCSEEKQRKARVRNILKSLEKTQYWMNTLYTYYTYAICICYLDHVLGLRVWFLAALTVRPVKEAVLQINQIQTSRKMDINALKKWTVQVVFPRCWNNWIELLYRSIDIGISGSWYHIRSIKSNKFDI